MLIVALSSDVFEVFAIAFFYSISCDLSELDPLSWFLICFWSFGELLDEMTCHLTLEMTAISVSVKH